MVTKKARAEVVYTCNYETLLYSTTQPSPSRGPGLRLLGLRRTWVMFRQVVPEP